MPGTQGYVDREQSDVIKYFLCVQVHFDEFRYLEMFKFCLEKTSNTLISVTEVRTDHQIVVPRVTNRKFFGSTL